MSAHKLLGERSIENLKDKYISCLDGGLYWLHDGSLCRRNYEGQHERIRSITDLKATLRSGPYTWPGGHELFFITADGGSLKFSTVLAEYKNVIDSMHNQINDGFFVVGTEVNWENDNLYDDHTGEKIEPEYGE